MRARQQAVDGEILRRLRTAALRPTVLRIGILQLLDDCTTRRLTAEAVFRALLARGLSPCHGTVYRTLKDLAEHGLLRHEWCSGPGRARAVYGAQATGRPAGGAVVRCTACNAETEIGDPEWPRRLQQLALRQGLDVALRPMTIQVLCTSCAESRSGRPAASRPAGVFTPRPSPTAAQRSSRQASP